MLLLYLAIFLLAFEFKVFNLIFHKLRESKVVPVRLDLAARTCDILISLGLIHHWNHMTMPVIVILRHLLNGESIILVFVGIVLL